MLGRIVAVLLLMQVSHLIASGAAKQPHILFIVSDDLGWNDVSFHGSPQIGTPNIDYLAKRGMILDNHRVQPVCSPTRSTILSGRHVIHTGIYMPFSEAGNLRLNLTYTLLPEYLRAANYSTHMIGKWHLGQNVLAALPNARGFDEYLGYWAGAEDYFEHVDGPKNAGYDFNDNLKTAFEYKGQYSELVFNAKAVETIKQFNASSPKPMFMYLAFQNVHWPLQAPQHYVDMYSHVPDSARQYVCAMAKIMDDGIGNITKALKEQGIFDDTLIVFTADNGGPTNHTEGTFSNNYPLRGGKNTIYEGGTRASAFVSGWGIKNPGTVSSEYIHAADWLPTLVTAATNDDWRKLIPSDEPPYLLGDGINVWDMIADGAPSPRTEVVLECHPGGESIVHGNALLIGDMKAVKIGQTCPVTEFGWTPPPGENPDSTPYTTKCPPIPKHPFDCSTRFCLFNVTADPCETTNLAEDHPDILETIVTRLRSYQATAVPPVTPEGCMPVVDKKGAWRPCDDPSVELP